MSETTTAPALPAGAIELPGDQWAVLAPLEELDFGDVLDMLTSMKGGEGIGKAATELRTAILARVIKNWSLPLPTPADGGGPAVLRRISDPTVGLALFRAIEPIYRVINGYNRPVMTEKSLQDEASPTGGSNA